MHGIYCYLSLNIDQKSLVILYIVETGRHVVSEMMECTVLNSVRYSNTNATIAASQQQCQVLSVLY